jgi:Rrf2 family transcriptional regulator, iron-sulfur cluster assembly transcription factor
MLSRQASHALRALLELASDPLRWRSTPELATAQQLPEAMLEQLLLRLRRAQLLEARRGRCGGYRLARPASAISVAAVLAAIGVRPQPPWPGTAAQAPPAPSQPEPAASEQVTRALQQRLERALNRSLEELSLEELLFDLRSAEASQGVGGGLLLG